MWFVDPSYKINKPEYNTSIGGNENDNLRSFLIGLLDNDGTYNIYNA